MFLGSSTQRQLTNRSLGLSIPRSVKVLQNNLPTTDRATSRAYRLLSTLAVGAIRDAQKIKLSGDQSLLKDMRNPAVDIGILFARGEVAINAIQSYQSQVFDAQDHSSKVDPRFLSIQDYIKEKNIIIEALSKVNAGSWSIRATIDESYQNEIKFLSPIFGMNIEETE